jgi:hypothetical protein
VTSGWRLGDIEQQSAGKMSRMSHRMRHVLVGLVLWLGVIGAAVLAVWQAT